MALVFLWGSRAVAQPALAEADLYLNAAKAALRQGQIDSVAIYVAQARAIGLQMPDTETYINGCTDVAKALFREYPERGVQLLKRLRSDVQALHGVDSPFDNEICYQIARGFYFQRAYDSCRVYATENLRRMERSSVNALDRANHYNLLGAAYNLSGQSAKALEEYKKVLTIRMAILGAEDNQIASIYFNLGNTYSNLKLYNKALEAYTLGIKIREKVLGNKHPDLASIYFNVGVMYDDKGEYNNAIRYLEQALDIFQENPEQFDQQIAGIFNNLAIAYKNKGAYQEAAGYHQQSVQKYEQLTGDNSLKIADVYTNLAILAGLKGAYHQAVELHEQALRLYEQKLPPHDPRLIAAANNLGIAYADDGDFEGALSQLLGLVPLIENNAAQREQFANLNNDIADIYFKIGNRATSKTYNLRALAIQREIFTDKSYKLAATYNSLAKIAEAESDYELALSYLQEAMAANHAHFKATPNNAIPNAQGYFRYEYFVESLLLKAQLITRATKPEAAALLQAKFLYQVVDTVLTEVQGELISSEDKLRLSEKIYELSQRAIENCVQLADATGDARFWEAAFRYVEKSKNTVLTQSITANQARHFAGIPDSLVALENQLQSNIRYYKLQLTEQPDSAAILLYQNELFAAEVAHRTLMHQLEVQYPFYHQLKYDRNVPRVRAIQFALPEKTALVSYFTGDSTLYCFVITKQDFLVHRKAIGSDFYEQQVGLRKSIALQLDEDYLWLAHRLYKTLFPFALDKEINALIIVPDGNLSKMPFEALLTREVRPRTGTSSFAGLPYLLQQYQISYALSGALFYQQKLLTPAAVEQREGLVAYAPVFAEPQNLNLFSSGSRNPLAAEDGGVRRSISLDGQYIAALPATADEVTAIAEVFQNQRQPVSTFLFQNANEEALKRSDMSRSKYIHIATHGFINEAQPDLSGLLLFPQLSGSEDHILYSGEVYSLNLRANLVVLSACETGLGKVANGEGLLGLSRAFLYAGAENLVVSLWKVQDRATADLMVRFYQQHLNGQAKGFSIPLRQAKLDLIGSETFSHPYYWSAFVLIGQ